jgi:isopentenyl-diphosphate delta-isomerase
MNSFVALVDEDDKEIGVEEKMKAHKNGLLHRAFSIFIFNKKGELLLQRRALSKYHSGGLWTNTCCGHPQPKSNILEDGKKRLSEEMGFDCELSEIFSFKYQAKLPNGLIENEFDHVLFGKYDSEPVLNPEEACDYKWITIDLLQTDMNNFPDKYTEWLKICIAQVASSLK